mmetsp:Transcript_42313/g.98704  ORF Transcript_42313/g.98704 Transcript_42313/m.98704 type:complete len:244 (+) Transcript_42313:249-980(+)
MSTGCMWSTRQTSKRMVLWRTVLFPSLLVMGHGGTSFSTDSRTCSSVPKTMPASLHGLWEMRAVGVRTLLLGRSACAGGTRNSGQCNMKGPRAMMTCPFFLVMDKARPAISFVPCIGRRPCSCRWRPHGLDQSFRASTATHWAIQTVLCTHTGSLCGRRRRSICPSREASSGNGPTGLSRYRKLRWSRRGSMQMFGSKASMVSVVILEKTAGSKIATLSWMVSCSLTVRHTPPTSSSRGFSSH